MAKFFDVWKVDTVKMVIFSYVEDEYGRLVSDVSPEYPIPNGDFADLHSRLKAKGYTMASRLDEGIKEKWFRLQP